MLYHLLGNIYAYLSIKYFVVSLLQPKNKSLDRTNAIETIKPKQRKLKQEFLTYDPISYSQIA